MKSFNFKKLIGVSALGVVAVLGLSETANGQRWKNDRKQDQKQERKMEKRQDKIERKMDRQQDRTDWHRARIEQQRILIEQQRQAQLNSRIRMQQQRQAELTRQRQAEWNRQHSGNDRSNGMGYYRGNANAHTNRNHRYRVYRNGSYYNTDQRGVELLRQAVNSGYQQGFYAGQRDRNDRRNSNWYDENDYRTGTYGYQSYVDRNQYQYYFQQGFQKGYQDGYNSYNSYDNSQYRYGSNNGGTMNILAAILQQVLNIQQY